MLKKYAPKVVTVQCDRCGQDVDKPVGEVNRSLKLGRRLFCGLQCSAKKGNEPRKSKKITLICPYCEKEFKTTTHNKAKKHCSRSCASKGSMTEERRDAQRLAGEMYSENLSVAKSLRSREGWKYAAIEGVLQSAGRNYEFEYEIEEYIFDLALLDVKVIVEFDGPYHKDPRQKRLDQKKSRLARKEGFKVVRRKVEIEEVFSPSIVDGL